MFESPVIDLFVYIEILFISGKFVSIQRSDNCLALRPPEFHILSIILTRQPLAVTEIDNSAILFIPTPFELPVKNSEAKFLEVFIAQSFVCLHQEPGGFDSVPRVNDASLASVNQTSIRSCALQNALILRMHKIVFDFVNGIPNLLFKHRIITYLPQHECDVHKNHCYGMSAAGNISFRFQKAGSIQHILNEFEDID